jgi:hypothetical protein
MTQKNVVLGRKVAPCSEIPHYPPGVRIPQEDIRKYGLDSVYRYMIARGRGASRKTSLGMGASTPVVITNIHGGILQRASTPGQIGPTTEDLKDL